MFQRRQRPETDFSEELRAHLELETERLREQGLSDEEARAMAHRNLGNIVKIKERCYEQGRWVWLDCLLKDSGYALRSLRKTRWFTAAAILILAFSIGSNLAIFRLIDALMLRSIPVTRPEELVKINPVGPQGRLEGMPSLVLDPLRRETVFSGVCGFTTPRVTTRINDVIASTGTLEMTGDCFQTLGIRTQIGRLFTMADDQPEAPNVVVLTASLWRSSFGSSASVLGRRIQAGSEEFTVIGVTEDRFTGLLRGFEPGLIIPLHHTPGDLPGKRFRYFWVSVFARRAAGISQAAAAARIAAITPELLEQSTPSRYNAAQRRDYLANHLLVSSARTGVDWMLRDRFGEPLYALLGVCAAILLIACLNLAGLLVARALARQKEISIRLAIGASQWRVMRPLALESILLAIAGGANGVLFASWAIRSIMTQASAMLSNFSIDTSFDARAFAWLAGVIIWVAAVLTVVPVLQARRSGEIGSLRETGRGVVGNSSRIQTALIGIQVAFTLALVTASGVFASSFTSLDHLPLLVRTDGIAEAMLAPLPGGYNFASAKPYYLGLLNRVAALPGIQSASLSSFALYWQGTLGDAVRCTDSSRELRAQTIRITDGYFRTIGMPLLSGEDFNRDHTEPEAIVSESVSRASAGCLPGASLLIGEAGSEKRYRVIGVAPTMRVSMEDPRDSSPLVVYLNFWQDEREQRYPTLFVRAINGNALDFKSLGTAVEALGREYVGEYRPLQAAWDESVAENRLLAYLASIFGLLALLLAAIGLFAILSCYVARRTNEIGIRIALGASTAQIRWLVLRQIGAALAAGIVAGLVLVVAAARMLASMAFGLGPSDPLLLTSAVVSLALTAVLAALIPAKRATSIPPLEALRHD
jgi:predicted permease